MRPSSPGSIVSADIHPAVPVHIAPFTRQETETDGTESIGLSSTEDLNHGSFRSPPRSPKSTKHSREPLLPIGARPRNSTVTSRPSGLSLGPYGRSESNLSASARVRGSFDKLFKRGLSFEGGKRPSPVLTNGPPSSNGAESPTNCMSRSRQASPITPSGNGHMTFNLTTHDDDHSPMSPLSRFKTMSSPRRASTPSVHELPFNPVPPADMKPPLAETPRIDEKTGKKLRNYQLHPSRNRFFLGGRILTGGDTPWAFIASLTVVLGITGVWFSTTCVWWWLNESPAVAGVGAYMCLLTISSMFATAFRDPGILPRNLDPDPPTASTDSDESVRQPLPRDLKVRAGTVRVKYCPTCRTYRPPRSSHCKMCDNCVDGCDHHCQWVNNCVGRRNYTTFFCFLTSCVVTLILVICTTAIHLWLLTTRKYGLSFHQALATADGVGSAVAFMISILVVWPVGALFLYHARLLFLNVTTIEQIRNQAHKSLAPGEAPPNPFSHGSWRRNLVYVLCRPAGFSWLDFAAVATEDRREVNPGVLWRADAALAMEEGRTSAKLN